VAIFEAGDVDSWRSLQAFMADRTILVAGSRYRCSSAMLGVAERAIGRGKGGLFEVLRAIVAAKASRISDLSGKLAALLYVANCAVLLQHRMRLAHPPARVNSRIARKASPGNPRQRHQWH